MKLSQKNVLITGASQGFGKALAGELLSAGCHLVFCARDPQMLKAAEAEFRSAFPDRKIFAIPCDVSHEQEVERLFSITLKELGPLHVLINNAGVYGPKGETEKVDWQEWVRTVEINLFGVVLTCRAAIPLFKRAQYGKIVNLSGGGATKALPRFTSYAASKAAVVRFTETLAEELRADRIDVNAIAPGALNTRMLEEVLCAGPEKVGEMYYQRALKQKDEGGGSFLSAARLCVYLASEESDGITGKLLSAQWDPWEQLREHKEELMNSDIYTLRRILPEDRGVSW